MTTNEAMKTCPRCAEEIRAAAIVCRFCGYDYTTATVPVQQQSTNGMAIASMVLGIIWIYWIGSILAVIFGHIALRQIDDSGQTQQGRGMAIAGLVLGYIGLGTLAFVIVIAIMAASSS